MLSVLIVAQMYVPGRVSNTERVIIEIGTGYYVSMVIIFPFSLRYVCSLSCPICITRHLLVVR